jgi:hypothetical protein
MTQVVAEEEAPVHEYEVPEIDAVTKVGAPGLVEVGIVIAGKVTVSDEIGMR